MSSWSRTDYLIWVICKKKLPNTYLKFHPDFGQKASLKWGEDWNILRSICRSICRYFSIGSNSVFSASCQGLLYIAYMNMICIWWSDTFLYPECSSWFMLQGYKAFCKKRKGTHVTCSTGPEKRPKFPQLKTQPYNHIESYNIKFKYVQ